MEVNESEYFDITNCAKDVLNPDFIRFVREPFTPSDAEIEVEFLKINELQGRIVDIPATELKQKLEFWGYPLTKTLNLALDALFNFNHVIYLVKFDEYEIK